MPDPVITDQPPVLVVEAGKGSVVKQVRDLWVARELLYFLAWRDFKVRYKQTALGAAWAIIQPTFAMVVFSIFFGYLGKIPSDGIPYPVFAYCALLPWSLFAHALSESSNSLISNQSLITKVYFPRLIIPIAPLFVGLVDFGIACIVLISMMFYYGILPGVTVLAAPAFILLGLCTALAVGMWLSALNVQYRDVRYTIPFLTQLWLFATPVAYPSSLLPEPWRSLYGLNPLAGVVEGFRWALLGRTPGPGPLIAVSVGAVFVLLIGGLWYFSRMEESFADIV
jgi:lipopolysaccharide transport system permease protein